MKIQSRGLAVSPVKAARFISLLQMYLFGAGIVLIAAFLFAQTAKAQEAEATPSAVDETSASVTPEPAPTAAEAEFVEIVVPEIAEPAPAPVEETPAPAEQAPVQAAPDAAADEIVTDDDLGVNDATILPDNPLYGIKRFGRGLRKAFTFNRAKKIGLEIRYANQELVDAQQLVEEKGDDPESYEKVAEAMDRVEEAGAKVQEQAADVAGGNDAQADAVVQEILDNQIKQQKVLERLEQQVLENAPEAVAAEVIEKIQTTRDEASADAAESVTTIETDHERLAEHFDRVLENQAGSDFKDIRNLEVLKRLEDHVPEEARDAIRLAEERTLTRFGRELGELSGENRFARFEDYVGNVGGDHTRHLEIFDRMKGLEGVPPEIAKKMELAKDIAAQRFKEEVEKIDQDFGDAAIQERMRTRAFARFSQSGGPDVGKLRVLEDIKQRVQFENEAVKQEFEAKREEGIAVFKSTFTDTSSKDQVARFAELSKKMAENPDPITFRLLQELEEEVKADPEKRKFIESMEQQAKAQFVEQASKRGAEFFERIASSNPQDIEIFKNLKEEFQKDPSKFVAPPSLGPGGFPLPPGVGPEGFGPPPFGPEGFGPPSFAGGPPPGFEKFFDQAIKVHTQALGEHVQSLDNPELFQNFQQRFFQGPPDIAREIEAQFQGNFSQIFQDKRRMIADQSLNQAVGGEGRLQLEQERSQFDADFQARLQNAATPEEKAALEAERAQKDQQFQNRTLDLRRQEFDKQLQFDPFCDEACRRGEAQNFEQTLHARQDGLRSLEDQFRQQFQQISEQFGGQLPLGGLPAGQAGFPSGAFPGGQGQGFPGQGTPQGQPFQGGGFFPPGQGPGGFGPPPFGQPQPPAAAFDQATGAQLPDHLRKDVLQREAQKRGLELDPRGQFAVPNAREPQPAPESAVPDHLRPDVLKREAEKQKALEQGLKPDQPFDASRGGLPGQTGFPGQSSFPTDLRPEVIQRQVTDRAIQDQFQGEVNRQTGQQVQDQVNAEILRQGGTLPSQPSAGGTFGSPPPGGSFGGGFQPPSGGSFGGGFQPPSGGGSFSPPPSGGFSPPPGGFAPQGVLGNDSPTSKVINILASFFGLDRVFGAIGL